MILHEEPCYSVPNDAGGWAELVERLENFSIAAEYIFVQELWQDWEAITVFALWNARHRLSSHACEISPPENHDLEISNRGIPGI